MTKERLLLILSLIAVAALSRLLPHPQNVSPIAAIALFAGAALSHRLLAFAVPVAAMLLSDAVLGWHHTMGFVYVGMVATVLIGMMLQGKLRALPIAAASVVSSIVFFIVSNMGVWLVGDLYPHNVSGLITCFIAAIPFFANSLLGDLFFAGVIFGVFAWADARLAKLSGLPA